MLAEFFNLYPVTMWDEGYTVPVGVDTSDSGPGQDMDFTNLLIQAQEDGTVVTINDPVNGPTTISLDKGENYIYRYEGVGWATSSFSDVLD
ncbi:MAG: hypothetical protein U5N58_11635 [Actinomycetota bacterium]|nr:hypothetical protein [Actinomycetota bacterium]